MGYIVEEGSINDKKGYILIVCRCGNMLLWRFAGRGSISDVSEENAEILGGNKKEERLFKHHGDIKGAVQG